MTLEGTLNTVGIHAKLKEPLGETDEEGETAGGEKEKQQRTETGESRLFRILGSDGRGKGSPKS